MVKYYRAMWVYYIKFENGRVHMVKSKRPNIENIKVRSCGFDLYYRYRHIERCFDLIDGPPYSRKYLTCDKPILEYFGAKVLNRIQIDGRCNSVKVLDWFTIETAIKNCHIFKP